MKICPACNEEFPEEKEYCDFCGIKLDSAEGEAEPAEEMEEPVEPVEKEEPVEEEPVEEFEEDVEGEECPICGTVNEVDAKFCKNCAANLEEAEEEPIEEGEKELTLVLPGDEEIEVPDDGVVLGREDFEGLLSEEELRYLSRRNNPDKPDKQQVEVFKEDGEYYVIDENSTNDTYLRGEKIKGEGKQPLSDGDAIEPAGEITIDVIII